MASYETRNGKVRAVVSTPRGKVTQTFADTREGRAEAEAWAAALELRKAKGGQVAAGGMTVRDFWPVWSGLREDPVTAAKDLSRWSNHVEPAWGHVPLRRITPQALDTWVAELKRGSGLAPATIKAVLYVLSSMLDLAARRGAVEGNPVRLMTVKIKVPASEWRVLDRAELALVIKSSAEHYQPLWTTLGDTGLRWGEAAGLPVKYVRSGSLWVQHTLRRDLSVKQMPKSGTGRSVPYGKRVAEALAPLLEGKRGNELVFSTPAGEPMDYHNVRKRVWVPAVTASGIAEPLPRIHDLRHSAATYLGGNGMPPHELRDVLGHGDLRTLSRYLHSGSPTEDRMRKLLDDA